MCLSKDPCNRCEWCCAGSKISGEDAPLVSQIREWLDAHPGWVVAEEDSDEEDDEDEDDDEEGEDEESKYPTSNHCLQVNHLKYKVICW